MIYVLYVLEYLCMCYICVWAGRQLSCGSKDPGRKAMLCGPKVPGRKAILCGPKGPGRKAYVGKSYTGELTKHLCLLVVFMFFRY